MRRILFAITLFIPGLFAANILQNGNFDEVDNRVGLTNGRRLDQLSGNWDVFSSLPGGWERLSGTGIEVQASGTVGGVSAHSGNLYVELDSHPNSTFGGSTNSAMFQMVNFNPGFYTLTFYYRPRTNTADDNGIEVRLEDTVLVSVSSTTATQSGWNLISHSFLVNAAGNQRLIFEATGIANQLGGFIDTVSLVRDRDIPGGEIPEPSSLALVGGAVGLAVLRLRRK